MSKLGLSIAAYYLALYSFLEVKLYVLRGAHELNILDEHPEVCHSWDLMRVDKCTVNGNEVRMNFVPVGFVEVIDEGEVAIGIFDKFESGLIVEVGSII